MMMMMMMMMVSECDARIRLYISYDSYFSKLNTNRDGVVKCRIVNHIIIIFYFHTHKKIIIIKKNISKNVPIPDYLIVCIFRLDGKTMTKYKSVESRHCEVQRAKKNAHHL